MDKVQKLVALAKHIGVLEEQKKRISDEIKEFERRIEDILTGGKRALPKKSPVTDMEPDALGVPTFRGKPSAPLKKQKQRKGPTRTNAVMDFVRNAAGEVTTTQIQEALGSNRAHGSILTRLVRRRKIRRVRKGVFEALRKKVEG